VYEGGHEADCPSLVSALEIPDTTSGGPHWGALDNFEEQPDGTYRETRSEDRAAVSNYFVSRSGVDGNHKVCILDIDHGKLSFDKDFRDEHEGTPCVDFNRTSWPHGEVGAAKPHSQLFVVKDALLADDSAASGPDPGAVRSAGTGSATPASIATSPVDVPVVTAPTDVPTDGALTEVASQPVSAARSARVSVPVLLAGAAAGLVAVTGAGTLALALPALALPALTGSARRRRLGE
jgi:hypothetical protein